MSEWALPLSSPLAAAAAGAALLMEAAAAAAARLLLLLLRPQPRTQPTTADERRRREEQQVCTLIAASPAPSSRQTVARALPSTSAPAAAGPAPLDQAERTRGEEERKEGRGTQRKACGGFEPHRGFWRDPNRPCNNDANDPFTRCSGQCRIHALSRCSLLTADALHTIQQPPSPPSVAFQLPPLPFFPPPQLPAAGELLLLLSPPPLLLLPQFCAPWRT